MIRILVADDSSVVRRAVSAVLGAEPDLEVAATAPNAHIALEKLGALAVDLVVLGLELSTEGGAMLAEMRRRGLGTPVLAFCASTPKEPAELGVAGHVQRPTGFLGDPAVQAALREPLVARVRTLLRLPAPPAAQAPAPPPPAVRRVSPGPIELVVIGASTGGPNALAEVMQALPAAFPVPVVIAQHMPPGFTKQLARRLDQVSGLDVAEAEEGGVLAPGRALVAPGDRHLVLARRGAAVVATLTLGPKEHSTRPAVDPLLRSAVEAYGAHILAVILTGMGYDGAAGCALVREAGGHVIAQDRVTSVVWGMPGAVCRAGLACAELPLARVGPEIARRVHESRGSSPSASRKGA